MLSNRNIKILIITLLLILCFETIIYSPVIFDNPEFKIEYFNGSILEYKVAAGSYPMNVKMLIYKVDQEKKRDILNNKEIYIYYDPNYQHSGISLKQSLGLANHLIPELQIRGYPGKIYVVNASRLKYIMSDLNKAKSRIIIMTSGAFPNTVYTKEKNLVKPWIEHGGTLIWIGDMIGYYSADKTTEKLDPLDPKHPKKDGAINLLGDDNFIIVKKWTEKAEADSIYSEALNLKYPYISRGISIAMAIKSGGKILGKMSDGYTSIASIPIDRGILVLFGGAIVDKKGEFIVAKDMAQIINSKILYSKELIYNNKYQLNPHEVIKNKIIINNKDNYILYIYSVDEESTFFRIIYIEQSSIRYLNNISNRY